MLHSIDDIIKKESNLYKAIVIIGKEAEWLSSLEHTTVKKPMYKSIEHFIKGKIHYEIKEEED